MHVSMSMRRHELISGQHRQAFNLEELYLRDLTLNSGGHSVWQLNDHMTSYGVETEASSSLPQCTSIASRMVSIL